MALKSALAGAFLPARNTPWIWGTCPFMFFCAFLMILGSHPNRNQSAMMKSVVRHGVHSFPNDISRLAAQSAISSKISRVNRGRRAYLRANCDKLALGAVSQSQSFALAESIALHCIVSKTLCYLILSYHIYIYREREREREREIDRYIVLL